MIRVGPRESYRNPHRYPWYWTGDVPQMVRQVTDKSSHFFNGLGPFESFWVPNGISGHPGGLNGYDISVEVPKLRGGDALASVS